MLTKDLFQSVLLEPAVKHKADAMLSVSGYATPIMANYHMKLLSEQECYPRVELVIGMAQGGILARHHKDFQHLTPEAHGCPFECRYLTQGFLAHAKVFVWMRDEKPVVAFAGSANYTRTGFSDSQIEVMESVSPSEAKSFFDTIKARAVSCKSQKVKEKVKFVETQPRGAPVEKFEKSVELSLTITKGAKKGETHNHAGINWGQRSGRNPDQAYIPISSAVLHDEFFPPKGDEFTILADDGTSLTMVVAQMEGKALHSVPNNSEIGEYLRRRIGVPLGSYVEAKHLKAYGRTTITFYKMSTGKYYMDFGV